MGEKSANEILCDDDDVCLENNQQKDTLPYVNI